MYSGGISYDEYKITKTILIDYLKKENIKIFLN